MKKIFIIILFFVSVQGWSQQNKIIERMEKFHYWMVHPSFVIEQYIHDSLTYGHSNGWIENAEEFRKDLGTIITYHSIKEDSVVAVKSGKTAYIRFISEVDVTLRGVRSQFRLRVLEVWAKSQGVWKILARQAVRG
jgi:hypothetical protein